MWQNVRIHIILYVRRLIRPFALHWNILSYPMILFADSKGPDLQECPHMPEDTFSHATVYIIEFIYWILEQDKQNADIFV